MTLALDNDVVLKGTCYGIIDDLIAALGHSRSDVRVLGAAKYVLPKALKAKQLRGDRVAVEYGLRAILDEFTSAEPNIEELRLAAELEFLAQEHGLSLDQGESQLAAMAITQSVGRIATGDKRAIAAIEKLAETHKNVQAIFGRVICLEQIVLALIQVSGVQSVRSSVCSEPAVDKAVTNCFSCSLDVVVQEDVCAGLRSYIEHLRHDAPNVLALSHLTKTA